MYDGDEMIYSLFIFWKYTHIYFYNEVNDNILYVFYSGLQAKRKELEEQPLQTNTLRSLENENALQKHLTSHPFTIVRIRYVIMSCSLGNPLN